MTNSRVYITRTDDSLRHVLDTRLILQVPDAIAMCVLLVCCATFRQNATFKAAHVEQQVWVVLAVDGHEAVLPQCGRYGPRQTVLYVPEHGTTTTHTYTHHDH